MPTWYLLNCAKHTFLLNLKDIESQLSSKACHQWYAYSSLPKYNWNPWNTYVHLAILNKFLYFSRLDTDIILCQEVLLCMRGTTFGRVDDQQTLAYIPYNVRIMRENQKGGGGGVLEGAWLMPSSTSGGKERTTKTIDEIQAKLSTRIISNSSNQYCFWHVKFTSLGSSALQLHCIWIEMSDSDN